MVRPTDDVLDTMVARLNRDGIVACADLVVTDDGTDLSMPTLETGTETTTIA